MTGFWLVDELFGKVKRIWMKEKRRIWTIIIILMELFICTSPHESSRCVKEEGREYSPP
jgi:hypothetical protein